MTCKCARQESVIKCYDKCGDDSHYMRLKEGEKGEQQIFCSQKKQGESEDMPIIGSDGRDEGVVVVKKTTVDGKKPISKDVPALPPSKPAAAAATVPRKPDDEDVVVRVRKGSGNGGSVIRDFDIDGAAGLRAMADTGSIAFALAVAVAGGAALL
ncbi:hypothetical protein FB639_003225 [Coemansia asiatica]|nr:hypothetical protein FB639_003225 [Coemansia asiatica]